MSRWRLCLRMFARRSMATCARDAVCAFSDAPVAGRVRGDRQALAGALCNLVENAWQAGGPEVVVELSARQLGR